MKTTLPPEQIAELHTEGQMAASISPFVDPDAVKGAKRVLKHRGEEWAASVLLRSLERRSTISPDLPWLKSGEPETLILADEAEWKQLGASL